MAVMGLIAALALPVALGVGCAALALGPAAPGRAMAVMGNGILLGLMSATVALRLVNSLGFPPTFAVATPVLLAAMAVVALWHRRRHITARPAALPVQEGGSHSALEQAIWVFFALLIVLRIATLGMELVWRPLFPWDATMHWATKAKVWLDAGALVPFVDNQTWLDMGGEGVATDHHADYPITIPLLQLWVSSALGYWDESRVNLPWLLLLVALGALFYGQGRAAGVGRNTSLIFTYLLLSMPLLNTHIALAGYADLFLGTFYCAALAAFYIWMRTRHTGQAVLAVIFALCCPLIKNEGFFWMLTLVPALAVAILPKRPAILWLLAAAVSTLVLLLVLPQDLVIAGHSLESLSLYYRPGIWPGVAASWLLHDNWHLFGYLLLAVIPLCLLLDREGRAELAPLVVALVAAFSMYSFLFLFTRFSHGAEHFTAVGRISLQLVPGVLFVVMLSYQKLLRSARWALG